ncbi:Potassium voltage-gated channel subfamily B member 2 [Tetrabaena socialis]|uniref:Potassium voltage-gated channel subfamily B member 2 n=1 Tax=Tetrabaena socialis TaxID=47790 RepID=A0A2J7ZWE8_9CHLO|nr:Potassium voltage-gated channel subfamily B member 2 [Tetrabaena socialis]|eukprot:PNH04575.1 Potassium voltage-gated channel subfamily B member 2 [Tetrabaena socialis]
MTPAPPFASSSPPLSPPTTPFHPSFSASACFCLETIPAFQEDRNPSAARIFTWVEAATIQIFALDYLLRIVSSPNKLKFVVEPFNIIDLIAIVPWYIITWVGADFNGTTVFRVIRLFRVFRVLKLGGRRGGGASGAASTSVHASGSYYVRDHEVALFPDGTPKPSPFESIVSGFWWAIVTLMTVGYGDVFPITAAGKFIACCAVICGRCGGRAARGTESADGCSPPP